VKKPDLTDTHVSHDVVLSAEITGKQICQCIKGYSVLQRCCTDYWKNM